MATQRKLTHVDARGQARMVDVSTKTATDRRATARGKLLLSKATLDLVAEGRAPKGDVLGAARIAGIMAAKRTPDLIPLCHPLPLSHASVELSIEKDGIAIEATVGTTAPTGVEMEALTAVAVAGLTLYDMLKAVERGAKLTDVRLVAKSGGRGGRITLRRARGALRGRGVAGAIGAALVVNLPGSPRAVRESLEVLLPAVPHAVELLGGESGERGHRRVG